MTRRMSGMMALALLCTLAQAAMSLAADPPAKTGEKRETMIYVRSVPPGAKVYVGDKEVGKTDGLFRVDAGVATVVLELEGYGKVTKPVRIEADGITRIVIELRPQTTPGKGSKQEAKQPNAQAALDAVDPLKATAFAAFQAIARDDSKTALSILDDLVLRLDEWLAQIKGTPAEAIGRATVDNIKAIRKALQDGRLEEAKALTKALGQVGAGIEDRVKEKLGGPTASSRTEASLLREAAAGQYWSKYRLWAGYEKGAEGISPNPEKAKKLLAELVKDAHLATFRPINGFAPKTPGEFIKKFNEHSSLQSEPTGLGGASFFRTKNKDGILIGSFITAYPNKMTKAIERNPSLKLISIEKMTPEMFVAYEATPQESLETGDDSPAEESAPLIVATSPRVGADDVDPAIGEITVTFNKDMGKDMSWTGGGPVTPPIREGKEAYWRDERTCVLPVKLEAAHYYRIGINSTSFQNFRSAAGMPAQPSAIYFATKGASDETKRRLRKPKIVAINPANGAKDVDPATTELRITFDLPMGGGFSWAGSGPNYPETTGSPSWSNDQKTCVLPVKLKPNWKYELGVNSQWHKNFQSEAGVPLEPVEYRFTTRGDGGKDAAKPGVGQTTPAIDPQEAQLRELVAKFVAAATKGEDFSTKNVGPRLRIQDTMRDAKKAMAKGANLGNVQLVRIKGDRALVAAKFADISDRKYKAQNPWCVVYTWVKQGNDWALDDIDLDNKERLANKLHYFDNILKNANCEFGGRSPVAWEQGAAIEGVTYSWDDKNSASEGKASLCIEKTAQRYFPIAQWSQTIDRTGDSPVLEVSAQVKAEKMTKAVLDVLFLDKDGEWISHKWAAYIGSKDDSPASHDWKQYSGQVEIPKNASKICIGLQVYGPGKVWFDDVQAHYKAAVNVEKTVSATFVDMPTEFIAAEATVPEIVSMKPENGAKNIDPSTKELKVTFNMPMAAGFSWTGGGKEFPKTTGKPRWSKDRKTCVLPVALKPSSKYRLGLNSVSFKNFQSEGGVPLEPVVYQFKTRAAGKAKEKEVEDEENTDEKDDAAPEIVSMKPANDAEDVDPTIKELRVTFNVPMAAGFSWTGGGPEFPKTTGKPRWSKDHKTCILPVALKPDSSYRLGLNSPSFKNFQSAEGVPLEPVEYKFTTRGSAKE